MFESKEVLKFFPTFVWSHQLAVEDYLPLNAAIRAKLDRLIAAAPEVDGANGWQTEQDLHTLPEFEPLNACVMEASQGVLDFLDSDYDGFKITGCWANISPNSVSHKAHLHPNNFLSGVYYVAVPDGGDSITFNDPRPQPQIIAPRVKQVNEHNTVDVHLSVREGMLAMFPAWLVHSVPPNQGEGMRISVAFNINFTNFSERISPPLWDGNLPTRR